MLAQIISIQHLSITILLSLLISSQTLHTHTSITFMSLKLSASLITQMCAFACSPIIAPIMLHGHQ